eukprot:6469092-Amphidinium_carterae.1
MASAVGVAASIHFVARSCWKQESVQLICALGTKFLWNESSIQQSSRFFPFGAFSIKPGLPRLLPTFAYDALPDSRIKFTSLADPFCSTFLFVESRILKLTIDFNILAVLSLDDE